MIRCRVKNVPIPQYHTILPLKFSVTGDGLKAETSPTIKIVLWNWHIIHLTAHYLGIDDLDFKKLIAILHRNLEKMNLRIELPNCHLF